MRGVLRSVVENGSGRQADIPGYRVAGKTGTAQIASPQGGYLQGPKSNMASFLAFAPADDPVFAGIVMLYKVGQEPSTAAFGRRRSSLASPKKPWRTWAFPGDELEEAADDRVRVPNVINMEFPDAEEVLLAHGLTVQAEGQRGFVVEQTPPPGTRVEKGTRVILTFYEEHHGHGAHVTVPDVLGRSMKDAAMVLAREGLRIRIEGTGYAVQQDPEPGTQLHEGDAVTVIFAPPKD